jgi:FixJ family two-component response regulator
VPRVKALFVTGYSEAEIERGELKKRELRLLQKPYTAANFLRAVRDMLDGRSNR